MKKIFNRTRLSLVVFVMLTSIMFAGTAGAATLTVDDSGGADYAKIQDAIDNAIAGDTVIVYSGTYYENVNVNKQLILKGTDNGGGKPVVNADGIGKAITLSAGNSTLDGFISVGASGSGDGGNAGIYVNSNNNIIRDNTASNNNVGIYISYSNNNTLSNNTAANNDYDGILLILSSNNTLSSNTLNSNRWAGIYLTHSNNNTLSGNTANSNGFVGIYVISESNNNMLIDNIANENKGIDYRSAGISVRIAANNNVLINNTANSNSAVGIAIREVAENNTVMGNTVISNARSGILVDSDCRIYGCVSSNNNLVGNTVISNGWMGITLQNAHSTIVSDNIVSSNGWSPSISSPDPTTQIYYGLGGIHLAGGVYGTHNNRIYNNYFNNTNNSFISINSMNNTWNITRTTGTNIVGGPYIGGNFWAHPNGTGFSQTCTDADRDGICDSSYALDGYNTDYLPLSMNFTSYNFLGILPPIRADGSSIFKLGSTVPVKFRITDANGNYVSTATATLTYQLITNEIPGTVEKPISSGAANEGNTFRYDSTDNLYIFNLGTKGMDAGTYQLNINLDDGTVHTVRISLR